MSALRGALDLGVDAVHGITDLIADAQDAVGRTVRRAVSPEPRLHRAASAVDDLRHGLTEAVHATVRGVASGVGLAAHAGLDALGDPPPPPTVPTRSDGKRQAPWILDASQGLVNGVFGDHLRRRGNALDLGARLRLGDAYLPDDPSAWPEHLRGIASRVVVFVHGLATTEWCWWMDAEAKLGDPTASFGTRIESELGWTPLYLRYNTGVPTAESGEALAKLLDALASTAPGLSDLAVVGHSMGGLVVRQACAAADRRGHRWLHPLRHAFCLGAPHRGAGLARWNEGFSERLLGVDLPGTRVVGRLLGLRSTGISDLCHGLDFDTAPLTPDVTWHFVAASLSRQARPWVDLGIGDLLVDVPSALCPGSGGDVRTHRFGGVGHTGLTTDPRVLAVLREALADVG